jgi:hypothetical protein
MTSLLRDQQWVDPYNPCLIPGPSRSWQAGLELYTLSCIPLSCVLWDSGLVSYSAFSQLAVAALPSGLWDSVLALPCMENSQLEPSLRNTLYTQTMLSWVLPSPLLPSLDFSYSLRQGDWKPPPPTQTELYFLISFIHP